MRKNAIYIGDNLSVMRSHDFDIFHGAIDCIYIDPPYNTASSFSYNDKNSNWKSDIEKRIEISRDLLADSGVIFISIDDNELVSLIDVCNCVFGRKNFIGMFVTKQAQRSNAKYINIIHEYVVCFSKNKKMLPPFFIRRREDPTERLLINNVINSVKKAYKTSIKDGEQELKHQINNYVKITGETWIKNYNNIDSNGRIYFAKDLSTPGEPNSLDIDEINLHLKPLKTRRWSGKDKMLKLYKEQRLVFKKGRPYEIQYIDEATNNVSSILNFYSRYGTNDLKKLGLYGLFDTPKPVELIKYLIRISSHKDSTILDFYAGSGTTAQAVYEVNMEDNTNHNYILIQNDENANKKSMTGQFLKERGYITPKISDALLLRINTFLKKNNLDLDYELHMKVENKKKAV